jgi:hypothetical protein
MILTQVKTPKQGLQLLTYLRDEVKANWSFYRIKSPEDYAKNYHRSHPVIGYSPETGNLTGLPRKWRRLGLAQYDGIRLTPARHIKSAIKKAADRLNAPLIKTEPVFLMGFEIEGCVHPLARRELSAYLADLYPGADNLVHGDGSIRPKCQAIEIATPPLPVEDAVERLEWLFATLDIMQAEGLWSTNHTTGFHVNLSEKTVFESPNRLTRARFAYELMKRIDPVKWRARFRRTNNKYCDWQGLPSSPEEVNNCARHWCAINTEHLNVAQPAHRRVELRVAGGKDYPAKVAEYLLDIRKAMLDAYDAV